MPGHNTNSKQQPGQQHNAIPCRHAQQGKKDVLLDALTRFYKHPGNLETFTLYTGPDSPVSLRLLDWFATNYSKSRNIVYQVERNGAPCAFNVFTEYKAVLRAYSKRFCDPFCRRDRIAIVNSSGQKQHTTVAQLCFFKWAMQNGILDYARSHRSQIERDMLLVSKRSRQQQQQQSSSSSGGSSEDDDTPSSSATTTPSSSSATSSSSKRHELSMAAVKACTKSYCRVTVRFS